MVYQLLKSSQILIDFMWICTALRDGGISQNNTEIPLAGSPSSVIQLHHCTKESSLL